ncbi:hypothetical protein HIF96_03835 [Helcococcus kunzii]|uniref:Uncharacterized protein n=1 Tax=Helcococcus kunzii ATCC 51366 TaxID=883114 RepID=H3NNA2_9FIRM|nr:hypothetical protein [Helcococcus kunzii]EHR34506.1 hypothetical protein HMPREF9709_00813 [Helcococcus kunzii ATCC 51366]MCT1795505.1 hypothetical protein [Helcococcus kunzii]MCT1989185.1 hypothetical protein [Helcococcus kunzii]QZO77160.1 hypothetical protein HIF96_03835 [Helcococcus kunzii]
MWIAFGIISVIFAILNIAYAFQNKEAEWFRFLSISFTALTVCSFYAESSKFVTKKDWSGLMDTMPIINVVLWICIILSIAINSISIVKKVNR